MDTLLKALTYQVGLDVATSLAIIGSAISFWISSSKQRRQARAQYAVDNLKGLLVYLKQSAVDWGKLGAELRHTVSLLAAEGRIDEPEKKKLFDDHILKVIFFVEEIQRELDFQLRIYFPVFSLERKGSESVMQRSKDFGNHLNDLKSKNGEVKFLALEKIENAIHETQQSVADELSKLLSTTR
jgi:hypothetical protein